MRLKLKRNTDKKVDNYNPDIIFHAELKVESDNDSDDLFIQGYASTADLDRIDDIVEPSAFKKTIKEFMKYNPVLLLNHGMNADGRVPVGKIVEAEIKPKGLFVKAFISKTEDALREKIKEGLYKAFSFGFLIINSDIIKKAGKRIRKITELELFEISVVSIPMNRRALFSVVKGFEFGSDLIYTDDFVEGLEDNIKGVQGDLDLAHKRICSVEDEIKGLKETYDSSERHWFKEALEEENGTDTTEHSKDIVIEDQKPAPEETEKEIRIRRKDPKLFKQNSFRRITLKKDAPKVFAIIGKLIGKSSTEVQSLRFPKADGWTIAKAVKWAKDHKSFDDADFTQKEIEGIEQEDNLQFDPIAKIKSLEEEVRDLKAGRVLSGNNRKTLSAALEAMGSASVALKAVLGIQEADSRTIKEEPEKKEDQFSEELIDDCISKVAGAAIELVGIY